MNSYFLAVKVSAPVDDGADPDVLGSSGASPRSHRFQLRQHGFGDQLTIVVTLVHFVKVTRLVRRDVVLVFHSHSLPYGRTSVDAIVFVLILNLCASILRRSSIRFRLDHIIKVRFRLVHQGFEERLLCLQLDEGIVEEPPAVDVFLQHTAVGVLRKVNRLRHLSPLECHLVFTLRLGFVLVGTINVRLQHGQPGFEDQLKIVVPIVRFVEVSRLVRLVVVLALHSQFSAIRSHQC